jgi:hypothetical protein
MGMSSNLSCLSKAASRSLPASVILEALPLLRFALRWRRPSAMMVEERVENESRTTRIIHFKALLSAPPIERVSESQTFWFGSVQIR